MRILVNGQKSCVERLLKKEPSYSRYIGWLNTPRHNGSFDTYKRFFVSLPVAADNSAFVDFDEARYLRFLNKVPPSVMWITAPDKVKNAALTLDLFEAWYPRLSGLPIAFAGQDGAESMELPWDRFRCLFIGGSTEWKLSSSARDLAFEAKRRGKLLHMGRVNSHRRLRYAYDLGCDSIDGTGYSQYSKQELESGLVFVSKLHEQLCFDGLEIV